jgi:hypothetical protein
VERDGNTVSINVQKMHESGHDSQLHHRVVRQSVDKIMHILHKSHDTNTTGTRSCTRRPVVLALAAILVAASAMTAVYRHRSDSSVHRAAA